MKHIKTFEKYKYLNVDDTNKLDVFVKDYIDRQNLVEKINNIQYKDLTISFFNYFSLFESFICSNTYSANSNNIYYDSDEFCRKNNIPTSPVENRNSLSELIVKHYKKYIKYFDKRVIELIEMKLLKNPLKEYKKIYDVYCDALSPKVKKKFQHILDTEKYNM